MCRLRPDARRQAQTAFLNIDVCRHTLRPPTTSTVVDDQAMRPSEDTFGGSTRVFAGLGIMLSPQCKARFCRRSACPRFDFQLSYAHTHIPDVVEYRRGEPIACHVVSRGMPAEKLSDTTDVPPKLTVLLAEDVPLVRMMVDDTLRQSGF